jgi:hypothetical protein
MPFFETRQNQTEIPNEEMENVFACIAKHFSHKWLKTRGVHPLQMLWDRRDAHSTNELYSFGYNLRKMEAIDLNWVKNQVKIIKADNRNNRPGAFFEINGLAFLTGHYVKPAKGNNPGFDAVVSVSERKVIRVSLKNYGDSSHYLEFKKKSKKCEELIVGFLKVHNIIAIDVLIVAAKQYPTQSQWDELYRNLEIISQYKKGERLAYGIGDCWFITFSDLPPERQPFFESAQSYKVIISAPFHANEDNNLLDKLDSACANLTMHSVHESEDQINCLLVHLHPNASISKSAEWVENYFVTYPDKPITAVYLYQPVVATTLDLSQTYINHHLRVILRPERYGKWNNPQQTIHFEFPIGLVSEGPVINKLIIGEGDNAQTIDFKSHYFFQSGNLYTKAIKKADGTQEASVRKIAPGVFSHAWMEPFPGQGSFILSGHFAPEDTLLIL